MKQLSHIGCNIIIIVFVLVEIILFIRINRIVLAGMLVGLIIGYFYWQEFAIYWGTYALSSECWVNCIFGCLFGGLLSCLFMENRQLIKKGLSFK